MHSHVTSVADVWALPHWSAMACQVVSHQRVTLHQCASQPWRLAKLVSTYVSAQANLTSAAHAALVSHPSFISYHTTVTSKTHVTHGHIRNLSHPSNPYSACQVKFTVISMTSHFTHTVHFTCDTCIAHAKPKSYLYIYYILFKFTTSNQYLWNHIKPISRKHSLKSWCEVYSGSLKSHTQLTPDSHFKVSLFIVSIRASVRLPI